ncbi:MAG: hypothetical protein DHS20C18_45920 [Saprospiraceae bacterium]|nr:MAG: hypothetical protein DHS20C18_45920 [Saprospiraceae bacterium]
MAKYYGKCPSKLEEEDIGNYLHFMIVKKGCSEGSISGAYSGIKLLWEKILEREWNCVRLPRPNRTKTLPEILSIEEVKGLIAATRNRKHKTILRLLYSTGLRMGELVMN